VRAAERGNARRAAHAATAASFPSIPSQGFPTILFFKAGVAEPIPYEGPRDLPGMVAFIKEHATHATAGLTAPADADADAPAGEEDEEDMFFDEDGEGEGEGEADFGEDDYAEDPHAGHDHGDDGDEHDEL
jgi:hypothetical protein